MNRAALVAEIMLAWEYYYEIFLKTLDLSGMKDEYNKRLVNTGREVRVLAVKGDYIGISKGINNTGELLVEMPDGEIREVMSGEVSVRGIYGYV